MKKASAQYSVLSWSESRTTGSKEHSGTGGSGHAGDTGRSGRCYGLCSSPAAAQTNDNLEGLKSHKLTPSQKGEVWLKSEVQNEA